MVRAAGGIIWRRGSQGRLELAVVHRGGRDDWTFPKGKVHPGESELETALREIGEETGLRCDPGGFLGRARYRDRSGRPKAVSYWEMRALPGTFVANPEVDELRWLIPQEVIALLSYRHDRRLLKSLLAGGCLRRWPGAVG